MYMYIKRSVHTSEDMICAHVEHVCIHQKAYNIRDD